MAVEMDSVGGYFQGLITKNYAVKSIAGSLRGWLYDANLSTLMLFLAACLLFVWWRNKSTKDEDHRIPPGSYGLPVLGETIPFLMDGFTYCRTRIDKYGPVFRTHLLGMRFVVVSGAQHVKTILASDDVIQCSPASTKRLFGDSGFFSVNGEPHQRLNRALRSVFTPTAMASLTQPMQSIVRERLVGWSNRGLLQGCEASKDIAIAAANELILGLDFKGEEFDKLKNYFSDYNDAFLSFPVDLPGFVFHRGMKARAAFLEMIKQVVINPSPDGFSLLHTLLAHNNNLDQAGDPLTARQLQDMALEMLYASQETVASSFCTVLMQLAENPHVLGDLRAELAANDIGPNDILNYNTLKSLPFLNDVTKEVLRYSPPIGGVFRKTVKDVEIAGYVIPKDWNILFSFKGTHDLCKYNGDVTAFDPYRWQKMRDQDDNLVSNLDFIPFGAGNRTCVGQDFAKDLIKVFILEIARSIDWRMTNGMPQIRSAPVPFPKDGLPLAVTPFDFAHFKKSKDAHSLISVNEE